MNTTNVRKWVDYLRSGRYKQANGQLAKVDKKGNKSYCCLGVGCVAMGLRGHRDGDALKYRGFDSMPPKKFHDWLGVTLRDDDAVEGDVFLDIPKRHPGNHRPIKIFTNRDGTEIEDACASLNDTLQLSFDQIADMIDYFGLRDE